MKERDELELILKLIGKYNLPLSPILEYAIKEKKEEFPETYANATHDYQGEIKMLTPTETSTITKVELSQTKDEQHFVIEDYSIENQGNHCYLLSGTGERLFSSSGKLKVIGEDLYRVCYTYSSISMNIVRKDAKDVYVLGKRILNAHFRSPLYAVLDEQNYLEQLKAVRYDLNAEEYHVQVGKRWYGSSGYYADLGQEKNTETIIEDSTIKKQPTNCTKELRIVEFGERSFAVIGDTKPHKDSLKAMGGYFMIRTQWGPVWTFPNKKRERVQAFIDGDSSVVNNWKDKSHDGTRKRISSRYIIRVKYPNGSEFCSNLVWETLANVIKFAGVERVRRLNIFWNGDNLVTPRLNEKSTYRNAQKELGGGMYVSTHSSTDMKYSQIERINQELHLGLYIEKVYVHGNGIAQEKKDDKPYNLNELRPSSRDRTKYSFEGGQMLSKRRFVLEVVKYYVHCHPHISYENLIRIFPSTLNSNKSNGVIKLYNDIAKQIALNPDVRNRFFLKDDEIIVLFNGMKIVVHNQWGKDFDNFLKVVRSIYNVKSSNDVDELQNDSKSPKSNSTKLLENADDKRIGYTIRLFPSQLKGEIVKIRVDNKGVKKLVVRTTANDLVEINDLPYYYEVLKRK